MSKNRDFFDIDFSTVAELSSRRAETEKEKGCATKVLLDPIDREALLSVNADIWTRAGILVSKSAELALDEISDKLGVPYRRNGLEVGKTWNVAMTIFGMLLASFPEGWEKDLQGLDPNEALKRIMNMAEEKLRA